jgi:dihydroxyacid dehydratase/phosphogluconate dehydratase
MRRGKNPEAQARLRLKLRKADVRQPLKPRAAPSPTASRAPARAMLKAVGFTDADLKKPIIGVANTWIEIGPATTTCGRSPST